MFISWDILRQYSLLRNVCQKNESLSVLCHHHDYHNDTIIVYSYYELGVKKQKYTCNNWFNHIVDGYFIGTGTMTQLSKYHEMRLNKPYIYTELSIYEYMITAHQLKIKHIVFFKIHCWLTCKRYIYFESDSMYQHNNSTLSDMRQRDILLQMCLIYVLGNRYGNTVTHCKTFQRKYRLLQIIPS